MVSKIKRLLAMPRSGARVAARRRFIEVLSGAFKYINSSPFNLNIGYKPDRFCSTLPVEELKYRFIKHNRLNNNGDLNRLYSLMLNLAQLDEVGVRGDFAELGVYKGNTAAVLAAYAKQSQRQVILFDTFSGFDERDLVGGDTQFGRSFTDTNMDLVKEVVGDCRHVQFVPGWFPQSVQPAHENLRFAAVSLDCDLYEPMRVGLEFFWPRLNVGGVLFIHDYSSGLWPGVKQAVDGFFAKGQAHLVLLPDKSGTAVVRKGRD